MKQRFALLALLLAFPAFAADLPALQQPATANKRFVDNRYIGKSPPGEPLLWHPQPGRYQVRVVDDHGRSDAIRMLVSLAQ